MPDTTNYKQTTITGEQWVRVGQVHIFNPLNETPRIEFYEEEVTNFTTWVNSRRTENLTCIFDPAIPLHADIYNKLNELYVLLREARDAANV